jgi:hypothetical protein
MKSAIRRAALVAALALATGAFAQQKPAQPQAPSTADLENAGRLTAHGWLVLLDRRDWGTAWEASSAVFRRNVTLGNWMDAVPKVREPLGPLVDRKPLHATHKTSLAGHPDGDYVTVVFESKFEKKTAEEAVTTMREADGRWRVTGYSVR